ncbi:MAG: hypothetical protein GXO91_05205 [FCB group bacterium]|nr:hypothetical protein [FCB group bacterium]
MKVADLQIRRNQLNLKPDRLSFGKSQSARQQKEGVKTAEKSFSDILNQKISENQEIKFSAHAIKRLQDRQINMSKTDLTRLTEGVKRVDRKGANSSLILVDDMAYIVSVKNRIVVTALDKSATLGNVFTNIDSVAIV